MQRITLIRGELDIWLYLIGERHTTLDLARTIHERTVNVLWVGTRLPKMVTPA